MESIQTVPIEQKDAKDRTAVGEIGICRTTLPRCLTSPDADCGVVQCISVTYAATQVALLSLWSSDADHGPASIAASTLSLVLAVGLAGLALLEHDRSVRPSSIIMTYLMLSSLFDAAQLRTLVLVHKTALSVMLGTAILCKLTLLVLEAKSKSRILNGAYRLLPPEAVSGIISRSLFWWTHPLFKHGYRRLLSPTDIYAVDLSMSSAALGASLNEIIAHSGALSRESV